jgi:hypothetical protein
MSQLIIIAQNPVRQSEYVRMLAERLGVREDAIRGQIRRLSKGRDDAGRRSSTGVVPSDGTAGRRPEGLPAEARRAGTASLRTVPETDGRIAAERLLLHLLVADDSVRAAVRGMAEGAPAFRLPAHQVLAQALFDPEDRADEPGRLRQRLRDDEAVSLLSRFLIEEPPVRGDVRRVAEGCLRTLRLLDIGERIEGLTAAHAEAVRGRDEQRRDQLAAELLEARREKERIRELKVSV